MMKSAVVLLSISFVFPVLVYMVEPLENQSPGLSFIGSFHPMVLHFPIALLCVIPLFELLKKYRSFHGIEPVIRVLLLVTCISAIFTASGAVIPNCLTFRTIASQKACPRSNCRWFPLSGEASMPAGTWPRSNTYRASRSRIPNRSHISPSCIVRFCSMNQF